MFFFMKSQKHVVMAIIFCVTFVLIHVSIRVECSIHTSDL